MNKGYVYIDGKAIISDENGNHTQTEYYDNLDKVLIQENVIEEIENKIKKLSKEKERYPDTKKKFKPTCLYFMIGGIVIIPPLIIRLLTGQNPYSMNFETTLGNINSVLLLTTTSAIIGLPVSSIITFFDYDKFKENKKKSNGIRSELEYLKRQLEKEKQTLSILEEEKTNNNSNTNLIAVKIDDKEKLDELNKKLDLYYNLGFNLKRYYKYYQKGKFDNKISKYLDETEALEARKFVEEKGPTLTKKKQ